MKLNKEHAIGAGIFAIAYGLGKLLVSKFRGSDEEQTEEQTEEESK